MKERLRFTGEWPPLRYWNKYPNWEYALDEEGDDDQDETTLRPAEIQEYITDDTKVTVADAVCADGCKLPALLELAYEREPDAVSVFIDDENAWRIYYSVPDKKWVAYIQDWLPEPERGPEISMENPSIFPLAVKSRLPRGQGEDHHHLVIYSDGRAENVHRIGNA